MSRPIVRAAASTYGRAILIGRGAHGDEQHGSVRHGVPRIGRELQPSRLRIALDQFMQPRFVDRDAALAQNANLVLVHVEGDHMVAHLGQAGPGDQADVARSDRCDFHGVSLTSRCDKRLRIATARHGPVEPGRGIIHCCRRSMRDALGARDVVVRLPDALSSRTGVTPIEENADLRVRCLPMAQLERSTLVDPRAPTVHCVALSPQR